MSMNSGNIFDSAQPSDVERIREASTGVSSDLIKKRIRANLQPLNAQISTLVYFLNQLIQENLAETTPTAAYRTHCPQAGPPSIEKLDPP